MIAIASTARTLAAVTLLRLLAPAASLLAQAPNSPAIQQQMQQMILKNQEAQQQRMESLKRGIVRVVAQKDTRDLGTGFVLSSSPDSVLILTALHVVQGAQSITVAFYSDPAKPFPARKLPKYSAALDLAVLEVDAAPRSKLPSGLPTFNFVVNSALTPTQHIWSVNGEWTPVPNSITRLSHDGDPQKFEYSNVSVGEGFSGGPIFDDYMDIIGMHDALNGEGSYAVAVKIDSALQVLQALEYAVPKAGPIVLPTGLGPPATTAPTACSTGCETTLGALRQVGHYSTPVSFQSSEEDVFAMPERWPIAKLFLHLTYYKAGGRVIARFAETDARGDSDMQLGIAGFGGVSGATGQGMINAGIDGHWSFKLRDPNSGGAFNLGAVILTLKPYF